MERINFIEAVEVVVERQLRTAFSFTPESLPAWNDLKQRIAAAAVLEIFSGSTFAIDEGAPEETVSEHIGNIVMIAEVEHLIPYPNWYKRLRALSGQVRSAVHEARSILPARCRQSATREG